MITDAAGFHPPRVLIPKGTPVTPAFLLTKDSTIHDADAYILPWEKADESVRLGVFDNYHREINPALVEFGRRVANASDLWDDDLFEYVVELDWNVPDEPA